MSLVPPLPILSPPASNSSTTAPPPQLTTPSAPPPIIPPPVASSSPPPPVVVVSSPPPSSSPPPVVSASPPPPVVVSSPPPSTPVTTPPAPPQVVSPPPSTPSTPATTPPAPPQKVSPPPSSPVTTPPAPPQVVSPPSPPDSSPSPPATTTSPPPATSPPSPPAPETKSSPPPPASFPTDPSTLAPPPTPLPVVPKEKPIAKPTGPASSNGNNTSQPGSSSAGLGTGGLAAIGVIVGLALLSLFVLGVWFTRKRKRKDPGTFVGYTRPPSPYSSPQGSDVVLFNSHSSAPKMRSHSGSDYMYASSDSGMVSNQRSWFSYDELAQVTSGFSEKNLLGEGGFGCVYKGVLADGREVAVKQLKIGGSQGEREFKAEVEIISRVHHRHLVTLVGYCISEQHRLLVYDYVPNNTLHYHLHAPGRPVMTWATRVKVAAGAARGIAYLHEDCHPRIIHRDIKSSNILLDNSFEALVADFGLAKIAQELDLNTHVSTRVMGTFGYMAPEYATSGKLSEKADVYSYGVILLELITGRKPVDTSQPLGDESLVEWARPLLNQAIENEEFEELVDPRLGNNFNPGEMFRMVEAAAACVRHSAAKRPKMSQVVRALDTLEEATDITNGMRPGQSQVFVHVEHMCSNALAMIKNMTETDIANFELTNNNNNRRLTEVSSFPGGENLDGEGWPKWLTVGDRRLLQGSTVKADLTVAADGSGDFTTIVAAVAAAPEKSSKRFVIHIKAGVYRENVEVNKKKKNIMFLGDGRGKTIITASRNVVDGSTTFHSATVAAVGEGFLARDITFQNTAGPSKHQAVALRVGSDFSAFYNCDILAYQDTLYVHSNRQFFVKCHILGTVDFIFGNGAAVLQDCDINARRPNSGQKNMVTAQGRTDPNQNTGIVIQNSRIGGTPDLLSVKGSFPTYLGRPWKQYSRTVIMQSTISDVIRPEGWHEWSGSFALDTLTYREYLNTGGGAGTANRVNWKGYKVITSATEAQDYTAGRFIGGGGWLGSTGFPFSLGL